MSSGTITAFEAEAVISEALDQFWVSRIAEKAKAGILSLKNRDERVKEVSDSVAQAASHRFRVEIAESVGVGSIGFNAVAYHDENLVRVGEKMVDALTDDGLAVVIAHEAVHLRNRHGDRQLERQEDLSERFSKAFEEFTEKLKENEERSFRNTLFNIALFVALAVTVTILVLRGFSRFLETEADTEAVEVAREAGFDVEAGVDELVQVLREIAHVPSLAAILSNHPSTKARERRMRKVLEGN